MISNNDEQNNVQNEIKENEFININQNVNNYEDNDDLNFGQLNNLGINAKEENAVQMDSFFIRATFGKMNTELTFFVENSLDYVKERKHIGKKMVGLVGMAKQGEILMPVVPYNPKEDEEIERSDDILSIVETSIFPEGIQSGRYSVLGIIEECELCQNKITLENFSFGQPR